MRISDEFSKQPTPSSPRLYGDVITALNFIKVVGLLGSGLSGLAAAIQTPISYQLVPKIV